MDFIIFANAFVGFTVIIDPVGAAIIFHSLMGDSDNSVRKTTAIRATLIATGLLILFGLYGEALLFALGINMAAMRIAGGVVLFYTAFEMITKPVERVSQAANDVAVFPLAIPMIAGPGSLTLAILLFSRHQDTSGMFSVGVAICSVLLITLVLMMISQHVKKIIGRTGDEILRRFLGILLAALAIQFIHDGIVEFWPN